MDIKPWMANRKFSPKPFELAEVLRVIFPLRFDVMVKYHHRNLAIFYFCAAMFLTIFKSKIHRAKITEAKDMDAIEDKQEIDTTDSWLEARS